MMRMSVVHRRFIAIASRGFHIGIIPGKNNGTLQVQQQNLRTTGVQRLNLTTPIFQVFGSNTDVGKTIVSGGICRSIVRSGKRVGYVKPLQTGTDDESYVGDATFIKRHASPSDDTMSQLLHCDTLFSWETPVSPHLAAILEDHVVSDDQVVEELTKCLMELNSVEVPFSLYLVETAGGVCSPSASMSFQADVYRGLRLPVLLVGDGRLGGISGTISALESLLIRGYDIAAVCLIEQDGLNNANAIRSKTSELGIPLFHMNAVPAQPEPLDQWFRQHDNTFDSIVAELRKFHTTRLKRFQDMYERSEELFWWPFTQHKKCGSLSLIDSALGDEFSVYAPKTKHLEPMFDACASWWTQGIGHGNAKMSTALAYTAGRYGHVMFPENTHEPAFRLSERLLQTVGKSWASRVYFSDDGSTAVEVALKMAFRKFIIDHGLEYDKKQRLVVLAQANCYHGDTLGVMNVAEPSVFNESQHPWYRSEGVFLKTPTLALQNGQYVVTLDPEIGSDLNILPNLSAAFDYEQRDESLAAKYREYVNQLIDSTSCTIGALLLEPVLIGAGGMVLVDPLFQRIVVQECRQRRIPVVFDEVFSGWWRLGVESGRDLLQVNPDIACYAKLLTGGVVPLAVTLASEDVFNSFYADAKSEALLHGHSFTAHPIGCAAALTALDMYEIHRRATNGSCDYWDVQQVAGLSQLPHVSRTFALGTVMCVELKSSTIGYASSEAQELIQVLRSHNIYARALGNVVYMMCSPLTSPEDCSKYLTILSTVLSLLQSNSSVQH